MRKTFILPSIIATTLLSFSIAQAKGVKEGDAPANSGKIAISTSSSNYKISPKYLPTVVNRGARLSSTVSLIDIGGQPNAYGMSSTLHCLHAVPEINGIACIFRTDTSGSGTLPTCTGFLRTSYSTDGGNTWTKKAGPIYKPDGDPQGPKFSVARYPQGLIYNPSGNTTPTNAFVHYFAPTRDKSNPQGGSGDWGGYCHGTLQMTVGATTTQTQESTTPNVTDLYIPDDIRITSKGVVFSLDLSRIGQTSGYVYEDKMILSKGIFNATTKDFDYTRSFVNNAVSATDAAQTAKQLSNVQIAFAPDGNTGYISSLLNNCNTTLSRTLPEVEMADSSYTISFVKTTDGGTTWSRPLNVNLDSLVFKFYGKTFYNPDSMHFTTAFEHSAVCDKNGNLHIITAAGTGRGGSVNTAKGSMAIIHLYTENGGTTWNAALIGLNNAFRATYNSAGSPNTPISHDLRFNAASTEDGSKIFLSWFDTDSTRKSVKKPRANGFQNMHPNMITAGYDVTSKKWTPTYNMTKGTAADSLLTFGNTSPVVLSSAGVYTIPTIFQRLAKDTANDLPNRVYYVTGMTLADTSFHYSNSITAGVHSYRPTCLWGTGINKIDNKNDLFTVSQNYPNPVSGNETVIPMILNRAAKVKLTATNVLGQVVYTNTYDMTIGDNNITLNKTQLSNGVIFYTIEAEGFKVTRKMIVE